MYKRIMFPAFALMAAMILMAESPIPLFAHGGYGHGGGMGNVYFDSETIDTLSGTLESQYDDWTVWGNGNHTGGGMWFTLRSDSGESFELMLAPWWYLDQNGISLSTGQRVTVTGSIVDGYAGQYGGGHHMGGVSDNDYVIVTTLMAGGVELVLRDERGYPLWSMGYGGYSSPWFDPATIETLSGTLVQNLGMWSAWGNGNFTGNCMHMIFRADSGESYYVMLGPWWYLEDNGIILTANLKATITGSVVESYWSGYDDHSYLIATEITANGRIVRLRDENGIPLWTGTGWHYYSPTFDSATNSMVSATVVRTRVRTNGKGLDPGYEVIARTDSGQLYRLFVAPKWHVGDYGFSLKKGQKITVRGSLVPGNGSRKDVTVEYIRADGGKYRFRKANGTPLWVEGAK